MGSVLKVGKFWVVRERVNGKQIDFRPNVHNFPNSERGAKSFLAALRTKLDTGTFTQPTKETLGEYTEKWIAGREVSPATRQFYQSIYDVYLKPGLGSVVLAKLTPLQIRDFYANLSQYSPRCRGREPSFRTREAVHAMLRSVLLDAVEMEVIPRSPMKNALVPVRPKKQQERKCYTTEEAKQILKLVEGTDLHLPIWLAILTGMRVGEICALKWEDIDLTRGKMTVRRSIEVTTGSFREKETKSGIERTFGIPNALCQLLLRVKGDQAENRLLMGPRWTDNGYVYPRSNGKARRPGEETKKWQAFAEKAGLPYYSFHSFRHTHVSILIEQGEEIKQISQRVGHTKIGTTADIYGHLFEKSDEATVARLDKALGG